MTKTRELFNAERSQRDSLNSNVNESYQSAIRSLGLQVIDPGSAITFERKDFGGIYVPSGDYGGFRCPPGRHRVVCAPGARLQRPIEVEGILMLSGAYLDCLNNNAAITVLPTGRLIMDQCQITKGDSLQVLATDTYVSIQTGGYASVNSCMFHGEQSNKGVLVYNADAGNPGRVAVAGSMNLTDIAAPYTNVTYMQDVP